MKSSALKSSCMFDTQSKNRNETATKIKIQNKTKKASETNEVKEKKKIQPGSVLEVPAFVSSSPHIVACRLKKVNIVTIVTFVTFVTFATFATLVTFATFVASSLNVSVWKKPQYQWSDAMVSGSDRSEASNTRT